MTAVSRPLITAALAGAATGARSFTGLATRLAGAAAPAVVIALAAAVVLTER